MKLLLNKDLFKSACIFAGIMSLLALVPLPMHSFRQVMQFSVSGVALWITWMAHRQSNYLVMLLFAAIVVLFNPFTILPLELKFWRMIYVGSALLFFIASSTLNIPESLQSRDSASTQ
jgi:hypothetical protein